MDFFLYAKDNDEFWGYILCFFLFYKIISKVVLFATIRYKCRNNKYERAIKGIRLIELIVTANQKVLGSYSLSLTILWIKTPFQVK